MIRIPRFKARSRPRKRARPSSRRPLPNQFNDSQQDSSSKEQSVDTFGVDQARESVMKPAHNTEASKPREERSYKEFFADLDTYMPLEMFSVGPGEEDHAHETRKSQDMRTMNTGIPNGHNKHVSMVSNERPHKRRRTSMTDKSYETSHLNARKLDDNTGVKPIVPILPESEQINASDPPTPIGTLLENKKVITRHVASANPYQALATRRRSSVISNGTSHSPATGATTTLTTKNPQDSLPKPSFRKVKKEASDDDELEDFVRPENHYIRHTEPSEKDLYDRVEYDMDEQDEAWLKLYNNERRKEDLGDISYDVFEFLIDLLEKEWFDLVKDLPKQADDEPVWPEDSACAICDDTECENSNAIVFCDGCNLAVHQDCYGIPYIPEGQWLCRKCMVSPDRPVSCIFCPNEGGAFKQTNNNKWGHLLCAIWIPEVGLSNPVYMEPIDNIDQIPKSRWRLTCFICKKRSGACIQCDNKNCFTAFHVTCGRKAKLYMKIKTPGSEHYDGGVLRAYCDKHCPREYKDQVDVTGAVAVVQAQFDPILRTIPPESEDEDEWTPEESSEEEDNSDDGDSDDLPYGNRARTSLNGSTHRKRKKHGKRNRRKRQVPPLGPMSSSRSSKAARAHQRQYNSDAPIIPFIILNKIENAKLSISISNLRRKHDMIVTICRYWSLKRESRRGAPLLKRLHLEPWTASATAHKQSETEKLQRYEGMRRLRADIEKLRLLCEQVTRREKAKIERARRQAAYLEKIFFPLENLIKPLYEELLGLDKKEYFLQPVSEEIAPDYHQIIKSPMEFETIGNKLSEHQYNSFEGFEHDVRLIYRNCMTYNQPDTPYYKAAKKQEQTAEELLSGTREKWKALEEHVVGGVLDVGIHPEIFTYNLLAIPSPEEERELQKAKEEAEREEAKRKAKEERKRKAEELRQSYTRRSSRLHASESEVNPHVSTGAEGESGETPKNKNKSSKGWVYLSSEDEKSPSESIPDALTSPSSPSRTRRQSVITKDAAESARRPRKGTGIEDQSSTRGSRGGRVEARAGLDPAKTSRKQATFDPETGDKREFLMGTIVWAKVLGFPAHPGKVFDESDPAVDKHILRRKTSSEQVLVEFLEVAEKDRWGWIYPKDITPLGEIEEDKRKIMQAKHTKKGKRYSEVVRGYRAAANELHLNVEKVLGTS